MKYYSLKEIKKIPARYYVIIGERSNGKTTSVLEEAIIQRVATGKPSACIRRWGADYVGKRGAGFFNGIVSRGRVKEITGGKWTGVYYRSRRWYLSRPDPTRDGAVEIDETPFFIGYAITENEHDKSSQDEGFALILFDEFISRQYVPDEYVLFMNTLSTLIRNRDDVQIYMTGNTINKYCPYFSEMGLTNILKQRQGTIDVYTYNDQGLTVAVEYVEATKRGSKPSDVYFAFDNPKLHMITSGAWEIAQYPHLPRRYEDKEVVERVFLVFEGQKLQGNIICGTNDLFVFWHAYTRDIPEDAIAIYDRQPSPRWNTFSDLTARGTPATDLIRSLYYSNRFFYATNDAGDIVYNFQKSIA